MNEPKRKEPTKCIVVSRKREEVSEALGPDWYVMRPLEHVAGRGFDLIVVACDNYFINATHTERGKFVQWRHEHLSTRLSPSGKILDIY